LLIPLLIELSPGSKWSTRDRGRPGTIGFKLNLRPRTLAVKAAPSDLNAFAIDKVLFEILEIAEGRSQASPMDFRRRCCIHSLPAAIKINMKLDPRRSIT